MPVGVKEGGLGFAPGGDEGGGEGSLVAYWMRKVRNGWAEQVDFAVLVEDEEGGAGFGGDAVRGAGFVGDVVGHAGAEREFGAVLVLDDNLAGDDEHDVSFAAPAIGDVFAAVVDEAKLDVAEFADAGGGGAGFAHEGRRGEFGPIDGAGGEIIELHWLSRCGNRARDFGGNIA